MPDENDGPLTFVSLMILLTTGAGSAQPVYVNGLKFYDFNQNGVFDPSVDYPLGGWNISLFWLNGTPVPGKQDTTGPDEMYNITGIDNAFDYYLNETLKDGWINTTPASNFITFLTCNGGSGENEFVTNTGNMISYMDCNTAVLFGYNARIGNTVGPGGPGAGDEGKIMYTNGNWNSGESSVDLSPSLVVYWQNGTYVPFNATFVPGGIGTATWTVNGSTVVQNTAFPTRPAATPPRDIVIRLHVEKKDTPRIVEANNLTLMQGIYTYVLNNPHILQTGDGDTWLVIRASNILITEGGSDIATGGFVLTGDVRLFWNSGNPAPQDNDLKMDILVGRYDCSYVTSDSINFGNHINGSISGYKLDNSTGQGLQGWNITAYNATRGELYHNITDVNGYYNISNIPLGFYWLNETPMNGYT
jgi:hypothetical protein